MMSNIQPFQFISVLMIDVNIISIIIKVFSVHSLPCYQVMKLGTNNNDR